jgi:hypothetical protein
MRAESTEQIAFMDRVRWLRPRLVPFVFAVPNGGARSKRTASTLKREGVLPGVPDIIVALPRGQWHGLMIEMKRAASVDQTAGVTSDEQLELHGLYRAQGYRVEVCAGAEVAWATLLDYLGQ